MENFSHFDASFNVNKTSTYSITIQFSNEAYAFCIKDIIRKQIVAIKNDNYSDANRQNYVDKIKDVIKTDVFLNKSYKSVDLIFRSNKFSLIPAELFNKATIKSNFKFNVEHLEDEEIHFNKFQNIPLYNVFVIPANITTYLVNKFPEVKFYQQATPIIEKLIAKTNESNSQMPYVFVNITKETFDIIIVDNGKLLFYNVFKYQSAEDFLFFMLSTFKNLGLQSNKLDINLSGDIDVKSELYLKTYKYFPNYNFAKIDDEYSYNFEVYEHKLANILI